MVQLRSALQSSHSHAFIPSCLIDELTLLVKLSLMYGILRIRSGSGRGSRGVELVSASSLSRACNMCFVTTG